ncbi:hypothetical protein KBX50_27945 [Micromonospora sp. C51]|uniref:hypothetical protein n=1 Tax=Micromonospora sp. C51 TaxID=2824879 RepID=UPI001B37C61E|nr:hypothetical protein [Micromonospora sp. C51]MBQ1052274.1 hypothetical protein [Micromonospora sp. C51]
MTRPRPLPALVVVGLRAAVDLRQDDLIRPPGEVDVVLSLPECRRTSNGTRGRAMVHVRCRHHTVRLSPAPGRAGW